MLDCVEAVVDPVVDPVVEPVVAAADGSVVGVFVMKSA
jgi:hypothetical protein